MAEVFVLGQKLVWREGSEQVDLTSANSSSTRKSDANLSKLS